MAGLGLTQAVRQYQVGLEDSQRNEQVDRLRKRQAVMDQAERAFGSVIEQSQAEAVRNGQDISQYKPSDATMLKAAEQRGKAFATAGDWEGYLTNEAAVQKQRIRVRAQALQKHQSDGNTEDLLRAVVPTIFDGTELKSVETLPGGEPGALKGAPSGPAKIRFTLSNGVTKMMEPAALLNMVKMTLIDPEKAAQQEIESNFLREKAKIEADKQKEVEREKARLQQDGKTHEWDLRGGLADKEHGFKMEQIGAETKGRESVARIGADARRDSAAARSGGLGGAGNSGRITIKSSYVNAAGDRIQQLSDGNTVNLGKDRAYQSMLSREIADLKKTEFDADPKEIEKRAAANIAARAANGGGGGKASPGLGGASAGAPKIIFRGFEN